MPLSPALNPPAYYGFGTAERDFTTGADTQPWPGDDPSHYVLGMTPDGTYRFEAAFDSAATTIYRVMGASLRQTTGIFIAPPNI